MTVPITPGSTRRPMGIETEFGVLAVAGQERDAAAARSPIVLSHYAVAGYALLVEGRRVAWDYGDESPLVDARGFELDRAAAHSSQLTDRVPDAGTVTRSGGSSHVPSAPSTELEEPLRAPDPDPRDLPAGEVLARAVQRALGNAVLENGARLYVDHAHPEYSSPEVMTAREGVTWDRAGERVAQRSMERTDAAGTVPEIALYKNNGDGKGASYGTHENYLLRRSVPFDDVVAMLLPFFVTRQVVAGSGRVGLGQHGDEPGYQLSQRADFMESEVGLETTFNRPIVNTRDEPHARRDRFRRLHVIVGDANLFETATFLKLGTTSLVLSLLESGAAVPVPALRDPVTALHEVSRDLDLTRRLALADGTGATALEIQRAYLEAVRTHVTDTASATGREPDAETVEVLALWGSVLDDLAVDWRRTTDRVEWAAKLDLLETYRSRGALGWDDPRLALIDLQWSDLRPDKSLAARLYERGAVRRITSDPAIDEAVRTPPASSRAWLRGRLVAAHRDRAASAGWDCTTLIDEDAQHHRLRLGDPAQGSRAWCAARGLDPTAPVADVLAALEQAPPRTEEQT